MVRRMLDPNDEILQHVRDLTIEDFSGDSRVFNQTSLKAIIGNLKQLNAFSWNAAKWIPEDVITKLEDQWPDARLSVTNHRRLDAADEDMNIDIRLLSSPLLHSLRFTIHYLGIGTDNGTLSELPKLKEILLKSSRLKVLHLKLCQGIPTYPNDYRRFKIDISKAPQWLYLPLLPSDRLTPLHELMLSDWPPYYLSRQHCEIWRECMDWSQLRCLDLGAGCPGNFFEALLGRVPNLKSLRMGFDTTSRPYGRLTCVDPTFVQGFIESIDSLHELFITNQVRDPGILFPAIVKHHESLQTLAFHTPPDTSFRHSGPGVWTTEQLTQLREQFTKLSRLEIDLSLADSKLPSPTTTALALFSHLRAMKLYLEIPIEACDFSDEYRYDVWGAELPPPLIRDKCNDLAVSLFQQFFKNNLHSLLTHLEVCFIRLDIWDSIDSETVINPLHVRRSERDDAPRPGEGGFRVEFVSRWSRMACREGRAYKKRELD
ncbi:hypothetical protein GP486_000352 [Trichoglossum hirsutum]|uniref:Uncharacterized protein n=1 Tax=Trichoglossum hirsutum TaxID=265104 RepID=A0A9P8LJ47_9PEZI|nr:hypothetical protein GP486_000352 [Trichoglossum hirsutum]